MDEFELMRDESTGRNGVLVQMGEGDDGRSSRDVARAVWHSTPPAEANTQRSPKTPTFIILTFQAHHVGRRRSAKERAICTQGGGGTAAPER
jgi:hypothetical protein